MAINLKDTVQIIRGKKTDIAARTGANGELNWADDTYELYIHDGKTRGGHLIGKASGTAGVVGGAGIAVSTSDGISTVSIKRDPSNVLYATTDGAGVRIGTSGALQITAQNALDLRVAEGGGIIVDSNGVKIDSAVLSSVFRYAGQVNSVDDLPSDAQPGDVYDVKDSGANYVWSGTSWDNLGGIMSVDAAPTQGSTNPVASGGVYDAIQNVKLSGDGTTVTVTNNIISVHEYEGATADTAATSGLVPPAAAGEQDKVLRGDGEWHEIVIPPEITLSDSVTSESSTTAASSKAVKTAYDTAVTAQATADSKVSKSGDTMTGALVAPRFHARSSDTILTNFQDMRATLGTAPATELDEQVWFDDKNGNHIGILQHIMYPDGRNSIMIMTRTQNDNNWASLFVTQTADRTNVAGTSGTQFQFGNGTAIWVE